MKALFLAIAIGCLTVSLLPAQVGVITPTPIAQPVYTQLKAFLNLTDAQVQSLVQIQSNRTAAQQAIYKQINDKQTQLNQSAPPRHLGRADRWPARNRYQQFTKAVATPEQFIPCFGARRPHA